MHTISILTNIFNIPYLKIIVLYSNKPGTAKVGAISKAQNCKRGNPLGFVKLQLVAKFQKKLKGDPLETLKKSKKLKIEIFEQGHSAENSERGTLLDFLTSIVLQNNLKN